MAELKNQTFSKSQLVQLSVKAGKAGQSTVRLALDKKGPQASVFAAKRKEKRKEPAAPAAMPKPAPPKAPPVKEVVT